MQTLYIQESFDQVRKKIPTKRITDLPIKIIEVEQKNVKIEYLASFETRAEEYLEDFDGFFYSLRGCLDSFFWEINLIFKLGFETISYGKIKDTMKGKYNKKATTRLLAKLENEPWFNYMNKMRNTLTHHTLSELVAFTEDFMIYLPWDPIKNLYSKEERYEVLNCLKTLYDSTLEFLEKGYEAIVFDLKLCQTKKS